MTAPTLHLRNGGVPAQAVLAGVQLHEVSLRHQTVIIQQGTDGVCVKTKHAPLDVTGALSRERIVYQLLHGQRTPVRQALPSLVESEPGSAAVVTRLVPQAVTLREYFSGLQQDAQRLGSHLGVCIAQVHTTDVRAGLLPAASGNLHWIATLLQPGPAAFAELSAASLDLVKTLQAAAGFGRALHTLPAKGRRAVLIHNDLKWDNILVHPREGETEPTQIKLIDWEMAGLGDPDWDVGTVLSEFLAFWAISIPMVANEPPDTFMQLARYPIEDLQPAIGAFWRGYVGEMGFDQTVAYERLIRSTRYAGARLIQTAYERTQTMSRLTPQIYLLLQLSLNVLEQPEDAAEQLLGITS